MVKSDWSRDGLHPIAVMRRPSKKRPCERKDKHVEVEDHGNGFMFVGCSDIDQAKRILRDYVSKKEAKQYVFAGRAAGYREGCCCVWLAVEPFAAWEGQEWMPGYPVAR
jgi:hypothetical protein